MRAALAIGDHLGGGRRQRVEPDFAPDAVLPAPGDVVPVVLAGAVGDDAEAVNRRLRRGLLDPAPLVAVLLA